MMEGNFTYRVGVSIKYNLIHFDFSVRSEKYGVSSGGGFGLLVQLMTNWEMPISSPGFYDLRSFQNLIKDLILLFDDIKSRIEISFRK